MKIYFSNQGHLRNLQSFIKDLEFHNPKTLEIATHDKWITVHPANLVLTAALALQVGVENATLTGSIPKTGMYLDRMGLYKLLSTPSPFIYEKKEESGRFIPITVIKTADDQSKFIADMIPLLHLSEANSTIVKYVIGELVRNVLEHALAPHGAVVAAQYYKKTNRLSIGICDTGIGIWKSMREYWQPKTDLDAIYYALTPGITGTTRKEGGTSENAGAGLFFIKSIAKITRGYFSIYSGEAEYTLLKHDKRVKVPRLIANPQEDLHRDTNTMPFFQGTLVGVDIPLDETPEFTTLLSNIGKVYDDSIRERKRFQYRTPKFI